MSLARYARSRASLPARWLTSPGNEPATVNAYGYVRNNPTTRVDPTGLESVVVHQPPRSFPRLVETPIGDGYTRTDLVFEQIPTAPVRVGNIGVPPSHLVAQSQDERLAVLTPTAQMLSGFAAVGSFSDAEGLARLSEDVAALAPDAYAFVDDLSLLVGGVRPNLLDVLATNRFVPRVSFGQTGFKTEFQEMQYDHNNQVVHFVGYLAIGYAVGGVVGHGGLLLNEVSLSSPDYRLGIAGLNLGVAIRSGAVLPGAVPAYIRQNLAGP